MGKEADDHCRNSTDRSGHQAEDAADHRQQAENESQNRHGVG